jgi:hypothetical protein
MVTTIDLPRHGYFPATVRAERDSPIDALVAACVPQHEALDLVVAAWWQPAAHCLLATIDGGRPVVVVPTPDGRWAACNAFLDEMCRTAQEAELRLSKKFGRRKGYVVCVSSATDQDKSN